MTKGQGPEWEHVSIIEQKREQPKVQCKYCTHEFVGGAARIRQHILHTKGALRGVQKCTAAEEELEDVVAEMKEIEEASAAMDRARKKQRQLGRNSSGVEAAAAAAGQKRQLTLQDTRLLPDYGRGPLGALFATFLPILQQYP